jgi:hypothetical protein
MKTAHKLGTGTAALTLTWIFYITHKIIQELLSIYEFVLQDAHH